MSAALPPKAQLARILDSLAQHLGPQLETLLAHDRFADGAAALARMASPEHRDAVLSLVGEEEAAWLSEQLLATWAEVGEIRLAPIAAIQGPTEVWLGPGTFTLSLTLQLVDIEATEVSWSGGGSPSADGLSLSLQLRRPSEGDPDELGILARVTGRTRAGRALLRARHTLLVRVPRLVLDDSRTRLRVLDQADRPGAGVSLSVGEEEHVADAQGLVRLDRPLGDDVPVRVEGVRVR